MEELDNLQWRKSTFSGNGGCLEVAARNGTVFVRDTKQREDGPVHRFSTVEWDAFLQGVFNGEFNLDHAGNLR